MRVQSLKTCLLALCFGSALLCGAAAHAAIVTTDLNDPAAPRDTGWRIRYDNTQVSNVTFTGIAGTGNKQGTLQIDKTFNNLNPISISFEEINPAAADAFGLRITLNENITNNSGSDWGDFHMNLVDNNPVSTHDADGFHPGYAHFHSDPFVNPPFNVVGGGGSKSFIDFASGTFANNSTRTWTGFGIHQFEDLNKQRNFTLVETPSVPEPTFVGLAVFAMLPLLRKRGH